FPSRVTWRIRRRISRSRAAPRTTGTSRTGHAGAGRTRPTSSSRAYSVTPSQWHPEAQVRVALDVSVLQAPRTGIGEYALQLGRALQQHPELELALFDGLVWRTDLPMSPRRGYSRISRLAKAAIPEAYRLRRQLMQRRFDQGSRRLQPHIYHQPTLWPLQFDGPTIMTLHDLTHIHYPETQPANRLREIERQLPAALDRASRILVDSRFIAEEVIHHYGVAEHKLQVAPLGHASRFQPRSERQLQATLEAHQLHMR